MERPRPLVEVTSPAPAPAPPSSPAGDGNLSRRDLVAALAAERASAAHWRRLATQRSAAFDRLNQRIAVRAALRLDRHRAQLASLVAPGAVRLRSGAERAGLVVASLPARGSIRRSSSPAAVTVGVEVPQGDRRPVSLVAVGHLPAGAIANAGSEIADHATVAPDEPGRGEAVGAAVDRAVRSAGGDLVCLVLATSEPLGEGWLAQLCRPLRDDVVATAPAVLHPRRPVRSSTPHDLRLRNEGLRLEIGPDDVPVVRPVRAGADPDPSRPDVDVDAGSPACLVVDRLAYERAGGLLPLADLDAAAVDLCARLRRDGGRVVSVPSVLVVDHRPVVSLTALRQPVADDGAGWTSVLRQHGPMVRRSVRTTEREQLRLVLTVACPTAKVAPRWGDWHFAEAMAGSLRRAGHAVGVQPLGRADAPAGWVADVHLVLRGLAPVPRAAGQRHVLWVISHPESITTSECDDADLVVVASARFADALRQRTSTPVEVLLQATDHRRFRPIPVMREYAHPITVVARTRDVLRPMVADALAVGLRPAIYGSGWRGVVDEALVVADHVANEELPAVYASAGVVLNDHWDTMRTWGFVSNRLFDVLACGTPVVSDHLPEVDELFAGAVPTYRTPDELGEAVREALDDPVAARARSELGRQAVLAHHTFDHRAAQLLAALVRHGLVDVNDAGPDPHLTRSVPRPQRR